MALLHEAILLSIVVLGLFAECSESMATESFTIVTVEVGGGLIQDDEATMRRLMAQQ